MKTIYIGPPDLRFESTGSHPAAARVASEAGVLVTEMVVESQRREVAAQDIASLRVASAVAEASVTDIEG